MCRNHPDLIPELQGRFPIRVELNSLTQEDFKEILTTPQQALLKQYHMLLKADKVTIHFKEEAIDKIAELAYRVNNENGRYRCSSFTYDFREIIAG